jgi:hypothetical protein
VDLLSVHSIVLTIHRTDPSEQEIRPTFEEPSGGMFPSGRDVTPNQRYRPKPLGSAGTGLKGRLGAIESNCGLA